ncbi:MAG TPA: DUF5655 domain-containing protein [Hyphomicrobiaceae bacterium]|jgi:hypothetical protein|nr:DUF5655 domain-containing protein [Hyphomicrobiaceae bacterium]
MAADERQEEARFLAELKARSGRDLAAWMEAIAAQGFSDKNEVIDWLRGQGFVFARASWLERIYSNGGRPIYEGVPERPARSQPKPRADVPTPRAETAAPAPAQVSPPHPGAEAAQLLEQLMAQAKGYRPLYQMLEAEVKQALPELRLSPAPTHISFGAPAAFAAVALTAQEVRLGLALGDHPFDARLKPAKIKGLGQDITHMVVLTDARQVNADLLSLVLAANARVNG